MSKYKNSNLIVPMAKDKFVDDTELIKENIRSRREQECFPYINRGRLWYAKLSDEQLLELSKWYDSWLDATETLVIPKRPSWLNSKLDSEDVL